MREDYGCDPRPPFKRRLLRGAQASLGGTGAARLYQRFRGHAPLTILMYHSVAEEADANDVAPRNRLDPERFERHLRWLARHREVLSLDAVTRKIADKEPFEPGSVALTFDDGYRDTLEVAAPMLATHDLPATVYLCTGYVQRGENQWADVLFAAIRDRTRDRITLNGGSAHDLRDAAGRSSAYRSVAGTLLSADVATRRAVLDAFVEQARPRRSPSRRTLTWEEVRSLASAHPNLTLGVHTAEHLDLSAMNADDAEAEVKRSLADFDAALGRPARHFSFPYARVLAALRERLPALGIRTAMTGTGVVDSAAADQLDLARIEAPAGLALLAYYTSGAHPALSERLFRRG